MSNDVIEAYKWWNYHINEKTLIQKIDFNSNIKPPECIMPQKAYITWSDICPFFQYLNIDQTDIQKYWEFVQKVVTFFCPDQQIPNPISHFPEFVVKLYLIRDLLLPKSVLMCLKFIDTFVSKKALTEQKSNKSTLKSKNKNPDSTNLNQIIFPINNNENILRQSSASFFLYNLPLYFIDPILYFQTLITLRSLNHPLWSNVISNSKAIDAFFEMHTNFILPLPSYSPIEYWEHRLYLSDTLFQLIEHIFVGNSSSSIIKIHPKAFQFTIKFVECSIKLIKTAPYSFSAVFFRYITRVIKICQNKIPSDQLKPLCLQFLLNLDKSESPLTPLAIKFLLKMKPNLIPISRIVRMISKRGIKNLSDIEILSFLCEGSNILQILMLLCQFSISNKLWHRACITEAISIIVRFPDRNDIKDWFLLFLRRLFIFVSIASSKMKYKTRTLLIVESLASMMSVRLFWLQQAVLIGAASIWSTKIFPPYFKNFFPISASQDEVIVHELELFANSDIELKAFPFDPEKGTLLLPPLIDIHKKTKSSLAKRTNSKTNSNYNRNGQTVVSSSFSVGLSRQKRANSRCERGKSCGTDSTTKGGIKSGAQKKRPEPLIKKPSGAKQSRPLASAIYISPIHRR